MKFSIIKTLNFGRFYVKLDLIEFTDEDVNKAHKFGFPSINIKTNDGRDRSITLEHLKGYSSYGFYDQEDADKYASSLKEQILNIKEEWEKLNDTWSQKEEI